MEIKIPRRICGLLGLIFFCSMSFAQETNDLQSQTSISLVFQTGFSNSLMFNGYTIGGAYGMVTDHRFTDSWGISAGAYLWLLNIPTQEAYQSPDLADHWMLLETQALAKYYPLGKKSTFSLLAGPSHGIILKDAGYFPGLNYNTLWLNAGFEYNFTPKSSLNASVGCIAKTGNIYDDVYGQLFTMNVFFKLGLSSL